MDLKKVMKNAYFFSHRSLSRLKDLVAEHLDHLHYLNDILSLEIDNLNEVLTDHLLNRLFIPLYIFSLVRRANTNSVEVLKLLLIIIKATNAVICFSPTGIGI
jgi:hypothetical protein